MGGSVNGITAPENMRSIETSLMISARITRSIRGKLGWRGACEGMSLSLLG